MKPQERQLTTVLSDTTEPKKWIYSGTEGTRQYFNVPQNNRKATEQIRGFTQVHPVPAPSGAHMRGADRSYDQSNRWFSSDTSGHQTKNKKKPAQGGLFLCLVSSSGFEPLTCPLGGGCAIQLCQEDMVRILSGILKN